MTRGLEEGEVGPTTLDLEGVYDVLQVRGRGWLSESDTEIARDRLSNGRIECVGPERAPIPSFPAPGTRFCFTSRPPPPPVPQQPNPGPQPPLDRRLRSLRLLASGRGRIRPPVTELNL